MNKLDLQIKSVAINDMEKIADFIAKDNINSAKELLQDFYKYFNALCQFPNLGHIRKDFTHHNVRFLQVRQNYVVVYNIKNIAICILRVLSNYQEICNQL